MGPAKAQRPHRLDGALPPRPLPSSPPPQSQQQPSLPPTLLLVGQRVSILFSFACAECGKKSLFQYVLCM